jgi:hypothetical protein
VILHHDRLFAEPFVGEEPFDIEAFTKPAWHARAACRDHHELSWFPEHGEAADAQRDVCAHCEVLAECAAAGVGEVGVWAGVDVEYIPVIVERRPFSRQDRADILAMRAEYPRMPRPAIAAILGLSDYEVNQALRVRHRAA